MGGAIFLLGGTLFGIGLVRRIFVRALNHAEQALWGLIIGWTLATTVGYVFARTAGGLSFQTALFAMLVLWLGTIVSWWPDIRRAFRNHGKFRGIVWQKSFIPLIAVLCLFVPVYARLFMTHMLQTGADGAIYSGGQSSSYDMAFHAAITTSFVHGANFPPVYTPMPPASLLYPFLPDFLTALLMALGMDLHAALVWSAVPLSLALTGIFYFFALRLITLSKDSGETQVAWAAAVATLLFFFNGGLGFIYFAQDWQASGKHLWQFLASLDVNYTHLTSKNLVWPNVITDMLLPQRTSLFGLSLGFIIFSCFLISYRESSGASSTTKWSGWQPLLAAGASTGLLPFFHVHAYAAVGLISGVLFLLRPRRVWIIFWVPATIVALPRLLELSGHLTATGSVRLQPGWRAQDETNWLVFWLRNVGALALLIFPAWLGASRPLRLFYLPYLALLVLAVVVVISPNDYDNLKLFTYWYGATCVIVAGWLIRLGSTRSGLACALSLVAVSTLSGMLAIAYEWQSRKLIFDRDEIAAADFVKTGTAPHSLFLTAPSLHQPILTMAGRATLRGPTAWLWSHGYPFAEREADVRAIYAGRDAALELLRYYRVDYIYLSPRESEELKANRGFFDGAFPSVYRAGNICIYDARNLRSGEIVVSAAYPPREYASRVDRDPAQILGEFPAVAYELYRLHKVAYGTTPPYPEFMADLRRLGQQLYLGRQGWRETLRANTQRLCDELTEQPNFRKRYDNMSPAGYVRALYTNAGVDPSEREGSDLSAALRDGRETRATILRHISADRRLFSREYNAAYVLCHYFGYFKRNPDDGPDHDLAGYNFWRQQLDRTRDYRGITRAFLASDEYKRQEP